jgi:hypothetical protein
MKELFCESAFRIRESSFEKGKTGNQSKNAHCSLNESQKRASRRSSNNRITQERSLASMQRHTSKGINRLAESKPS